jgi:hypothetical protein
MRRRRVDVSPLFDVDSETGEVLTQREAECPHCVHETQQRLIAEQDLGRAERKLRDAWREVERLKTEVAKREKGDADFGVAEAIFRYWVAQLEKNAKTTTFGEKRRKAVLARLHEGYTPQYICRAIDGLAMSVYTAPGGKRFDDLELVCRDEVQVESRYELAERIKAPTLLGPAWLREFGVQDLAA